MANGFTPDLEPTDDLPESLGLKRQVQRRGPRGKWKPERIELMLSLQKQNLSCSEIARKMNDGTTRNAVIGMLNRLGIKSMIPPTKAGGRKKCKVRKPRKRRESRGKFAYGRNAPKDNLPPVEIEDHSEYDPPPEQRISIEALGPDTCRWPIGNPQDKDFAYCGRARQRGSYCKWHGSLAYRGTSSDRKQEGRA